MRTIETRKKIAAGGELVVTVPPDVPEGEYDVLVVLAEQIASESDEELLGFPADSYGSWPEDLSLRREDMYDDWGR